MMLSNIPLHLQLMIQIHHSCWGSLHLLEPTLDQRRNNRHKVQKTCDGAFHVCQQNHQLSTFQQSIRVVCRLPCQLSLWMNRWWLLVKAIPVRASNARVEKIELAKISVFYGWWGWNYPVVSIWNMGRIHKIFNQYLIPENANFKWQSNQIRISLLNDIVGVQTHHLLFWYILNHHYTRKFKWTNNIYSTVNTIFFPILIQNII